MMKLIITLISFFCFVNFYAQTIVSGKIIDTQGKPIIGVNVYLEGTYDGSTSNENGEFSFTTDENGEQTLIASFLSYETYKKTAKVSAFTNIVIKLRDDVGALDAVVLSAGTFEAGDNSKINALKPLDVVTTASALGDFVGALQTLPGTTTVAEDGRLFVRGGEADETQIFIDGIRVFTPFTPTTNDTPTRGRYSPFLFDGITFSTGGYSAEYGQALSSVLTLNTINEPDQEKTDINIMSVGAGVGHTEKWEKGSISANVNYINLAPYTNALPNRNEFIKPIESFSGEAVFRHKFNNGLFKFYTGFDASNFELIQDDINIEEGIRFRLNNNNLYLNASYSGTLNDTWSILTGLSFTHANNDINVNDNDIDDTENSLHAKVKFKKWFSNRFKLNFGGEYFATNFDEAFSNNTISNVNTGFQNNIAATYIEADIFFSKKLAFKPGIRTEYGELFNEFTISPRASLAYKTSEKSQVSLAYSRFFQNPNADVLRFADNLQAQQTTHYILNYQLNSEGRIFRTELFYKDYNDLVRYDTNLISFDTQFSSDGFGFARGVDLFWRDNKSFKNLDYWVSYSYLDSERLFRNFPVQARPNFANQHNLSIVGKYWIDKWKSQVGLSYSFGSGRTFTDPNIEGFLNQNTRAFNNLSFNWAYLISPQKILFFSINNLLGFRNINGFQFADTPNANGVFESRALRPATDQFFFVGFFWTISEDGKQNQLDNL